jgi:hypothetical protein
MFVIPDIDPPDLHWLAGLLEGEGSFFPGAPSSPHLPVLQIQMIDEDVMNRVGELMDRGVYRCRPPRPEWSVTYVVRVKGAPAVAWMRLLRPLLGKRRQAQIDRSIASYASKSNQKLYDWRARRALELLGQGLSVRTVASRFDVSIWCIYDLRLGRTHKHLSRPA